MSQWSLVDQAALLLSAAVLFGLLGYHIADILGVCSAVTG